MAATVAAVSTVAGFGSAGPYRPFRLGAAAEASPRSGPVVSGRALFFGRQALTGRIREHQSALPPEVVKCDNCHGDRNRGTATTIKTLAPRLDRGLLLRIYSRRGGPPSVYDANAFCKLLRTGADPAFVLVAREMPIYDIADGQCAALWQFLTREQTDVAPAVTAPK